MAEELQLNIDINTKGGDVLKILKTELKEANGELIKAQTLYGEYSDEAVKAANKVAQLRDRIQEARETSDLFDPGKKFQALTGALNTVAGGFSAIQGAMGLFGSESENVAKTLLKVQSAMALSQGLSTIKDGAKDFERLGAIIKTNVVSAFSTLRGAIISTGLGALAVAIGLVISNWGEFTDYIKKTFPTLTAVAGKIGDIVQKFTDLVGVTSKAQREADQWTKAIGKITKALDNQINELEAHGGREDEVYKLKKQRLEYQLQAVKGTGEKEIEARADINSQLRVLELEEKKRLKEKREAESKEDEAYRKWQEEQDIAWLEKQKEKRKKENKEPIGLDGLTPSEREKLKKDQEKRDAEWKIKYDKKMLELQDGTTAKFLEKQAQTDASAIKSAEDVAEAKRNIDELEKQNKIETANAIGNTVAGLSNLIGQETAVGKGIAVASATIDTYSSASTIFKQAAKNPITTINPAYPYLMAAPAVLSGIARVKQIMSVQVPNGGGAGSSAPSLNTQSPVAPVVPTASTTNISQDSINALGNQAIRAYVVESDVSSSQSRIEAIRQRARFN